MAIRDYSSEGANLTINGIVMEEFGDTDPAITIEDEEQRSYMKRGIGGTALRSDNQTAPRRVTVNLMPGSDEARQLIALQKAGTPVVLTFSQSGSPEKVTCFDGIIINRGQLGRAGKQQVATDDQFTMLFNDSEET